MDKARAIQDIVEAAVPTVGGVILATSSKTEMGVILGACCAGSGITAILGMLLSEAIPAMRVPKIVGYRRLLANWLCGLTMIPVVGKIHRAYFPEDDLAMTAALTSGVAGLLGVSLLMIVIPRFLRIFSKAADNAEGNIQQWTNDQADNQPQPAPTVKLSELQPRRQRRD